MHTHISKESKIIFHGGMVRASSLGFTFVSLTLLMFLIFSDSWHVHIQARHVIRFNQLASELFSRFSERRV